jgi:hypothetical protein
MVGALGSGAADNQLPDDGRALFATTTLPNEALAEIGRAVAHFAILERTLVRVVQGLLGLQMNHEGDRVGHILTSEQSYRGLLELSTSLIQELREAELAEEYKTVLKTVATAEEERNLLSHSLWGMNGAPHLVDKPLLRTKYTAKRRKGLTHRREELSLDDLRANAFKISLATVDLGNFASQRLGIFTDY